LRENLGPLHRSILRAICTLELKRRGAEVGPSCLATSWALASQIRDWCGAYLKQDWAAPTRDELGPGHHYQTPATAAARARRPPPPIVEDPGHSCPLPHPRPSPSSRPLRRSFTFDVRSQKKDFACTFVGEIEISGYITFMKGGWGSAPREAWGGRAAPISPRKHHFPPFSTGMDGRAGWGGLGGTNLALDMRTRPRPPFV
jgi:hypothetical protein